MSVVKAQVIIIVTLYERRWRNCPDKIHCWSHFNLKSSALILFALTANYLFLKYRLQALVFKIPARPVKYRPSGNPNCMLKSAMKWNCKPLSKFGWPATNEKLSKTEGSFENWTTHVGRTAIKVNTKDTRLDLFIASWITTHFVCNSCRSTAVLNGTSNDQDPSIKSGTWWKRKYNP